MSSFESFFPGSAAPRNPYRHGGEYSSPFTSGGNAPRRRVGGPSSRGMSLQDRVFIAVGTVFCFMIFMLWKGLPTAPSTAGASSVAAGVRAGAPRLKGAGAAERLSAPPTPLPLMTFNLRFAGGNDGLNHWRYRKDHVADIINRYHPIVMGTQEGLRDQLQELHDLLEHPYERYGIEREINGEFEQIFYDTTAVEWLDGGNFWLSETPDTPHTKGWDAACVRLVTWCKFRLLSTRQEFFFVNTQLDHVGETSRNEGARLLWARIQEITKAAPEAPLFVVGDFNTYRHTDMYGYLTRATEGPQFLEAWPQSEKQIGTVSYTYHGWAGVHNDGERNAKVAANHIDWIFYRPAMKVLSTEVITEERNGRYPSDHYPIHSEFLFPSVADLPPPAV
ncbi:hypothetical protein P43SY_004190 [Pythium insidiosum]|uniref:Endonuclease/exonuclease/phosphatase domain-containing protein n=1 Tax=Pythium insidiosum TaxID=114742 RepID=A0AAD5LDF1_PYTIN|nr:hypothetical protein P43SY_004190 [Pythium insidiosum]